METIPDREGAGDAFVLEKYAQEVRYARSKRHENYALVVAVDGDRFGVQERLLQLDQKLADAELGARGLAERIAIFVPTRNVETWELWLCGARNLDEERDFKTAVPQDKAGRRASVKRAVEAWLKDLAPEEQELEEKTLPALAAGREEIRRLEP